MANAKFSYICHHLMKILDWQNWLKKLKWNVLITLCDPKKGRVSSTVTNPSNTNSKSVGKIFIYIMCLRSHLLIICHVTHALSPFYLSYFCIYITALKIKILLVPVNWSLQKQSRRSRNLPRRSQACPLPATKMNQNCEMWNSSD